MRNNVYCCISDQLILSSPLKQLTCVCEAEALMGSGGIAVELQPQAIGCTVDYMTQHAVACKVAKETG